jgi:hypothetical protein
MVGDWRLGVVFGVGLVCCAVGCVCCVAASVKEPPPRDGDGVDIVLARISFDEAGNG